jgi:dihydrofolate synthase/folylpolyglutamate synthase
LAQWLAWQEGSHPQAIDLGLERIRLVLKRLELEAPPYTIITVGGTNGKGSTVAFLEAILNAMGYRVGAYTSPHLLHYKERIRINGKEVDNPTICRAFACIDAARERVSLSYFEFSTLAALHIFREAAIQVAILEIGLGGRLDAVNGVDADVAIVTSIAIDHVEWLGSDRESIGREKAGIYRSGRPAVCADPEPPDSLLEYAGAIGASLYQVGKDYGFQHRAQDWSWRCERLHWQSLPLPSLMGEHQLSNAAAALMALTALAERLPVHPEAIRTGLIRAYVPARFQIIPGPVEWILDVAHNPHGATALAQCLRSRSCQGRTWAVLGMLIDKDAAGVAQVLENVIDIWYTATLQGARGRSGKQLADTLRAAVRNPDIFYFASVQEACRVAKERATKGDRIVVFGSFYTVAQALVTDGLLGSSSLLTQ